MPEPTAEAWAQIRHDYEDTDRPLAHICAEHDVSIPTVRYRMKCWEWTRRKPQIPREGPPAVALASPITMAVHPTPPAFADASAGDPPPPEPAPGRAQARPGWEGEEDIVPRLQSAVARVLPAIDATVARLSSGLPPREMEQAGRTLSSLTRALRELNALLAQHKGQPARQCDCDDEPVDIEQLRAELAERLMNIIDRKEEEYREKGS